MITYEEFGKLRLNQFISESSIDLLEDWEFEDELWVGEAHNFSEWLCLESEPVVLRSIAIDFSDFPDDQASKLFSLLGLPLFKGMQYEELESLLGKPYETLDFVKDRKSFEFKTESKNPYLVSCTVLDNSGLTYVVVRVPLTDEDY